MDDHISRRAAIKALANMDYTPGEWSVKGLSLCMDVIKGLPSIDVVIDRQYCENALLFLWMDGVLTDGEYNRIMDKLSKTGGRTVS